VIPSLLNLIESSGIAVHVITVELQFLRIDCQFNLNKISVLPTFSVKGVAYDNAGCAQEVEYLYPEFF